MNTDPEQRAMKLFTIPEANALLPSVRTIVQKIQRAHRNVSRYRDEVKKAAEAAERGGGGVAAGVKDFERGLVDFPSLRDGRVVLLCWQMGEGDELEWWHDVDAGFAGRTPL
jgi:hypothetical protein